MDDETRYNRQNLIKGWNQKKLSESTVAIIGSDALAKYVALPLAALGVGNIRIIDSSKGNDSDLLLDISLTGDSRAKSLEEAIRKINPSINVHGIHSELRTNAPEYFLNGCDVVVDATNSLSSKSQAVSYHNRTGIPLISASADTYRGKVVHLGNATFEPNAVMPMFADKKQGELVSLQLGGVIAEEVKKLLMQLPDTLNIEYNYNVESDQRFGFRSDVKINGIDDIFKDTNILMVGAGALGCFLGPATVLDIKPRQFHIVDYDTVEDHNLNRQVCYYDSVGKLKSESLAKKLRKMSAGQTTVKHFAEKFDEKFAKGTRYDLIFDAVDSFYTKAMLHNYAKKHRIPIISGGTDFRASTILAYVAGQTACFDCQINLSELAIKTEIIRRTSCTQAPDPSVIMTNQITGAIMVAEARRVLRPNVYGRPNNGEIKYISDFDTRGGISQIERICDCHTQKPRSLELPDVKRVDVKEVERDGEIKKEVYIDGKKI